MDKIKEAGFSIAMAKEVNLTREEAEDFYSEHKGKDFFEALVQNMCRYCYYCPLQAKTFPESLREQTTAQNKITYMSLKMKECGAQTYCISL